MNTSNIVKIDEVEMLPCLLSEHEKYEYGLILAEEECGKDKLEEEIKQLKEDFKRKIDALKESIKHLAVSINTGVEEREVDCEWWMHYPVHNQKTLVRTDTNEEVRSQTMSVMDKRRAANENQLALVI